MSAHPAGRNGSVKLEEGGTKSSAAGCGRRKQKQNSSAAHINAADANTVLFITESNVYANGRQ